MAQQGITTTAVKKAAVELDKMKSSLRGWLKYRELNDRVLAGTIQTKMAPGIAKKFVQQYRDPAVEQDLAVKLHALLAEVMPGAPLPNPTAPGAAVVLAKITIAGSTPGSPEALSGLFSGLGVPSHPWLWPVLIVGGLLITVTTAIKTSADAAEQREHYACIQSGACTDYGFWLKAGGAAVLAWFAWTHMGVGDAVKGLAKKRRS